MTTPFNETRYIAVEIQIPSGSTESIPRLKPTKATIWAAYINDASCVYSADFNPSDENETMGALEAFLVWANEEGEQFHSNVEYVVWKKELLISTFYAYPALNFLTTDWIDFISFYAGVKGSTVSQSRYELARIEARFTGIERAQNLATMFGHILSMSHMQQVVMAECQKLQQTYEGLKSMDCLAG